MIEPGAYSLQHDEVYNDVKFFSKVQRPQYNLYIRSKVRHKLMP